MPTNLPSLSLLEANALHTLHMPTQTIYVEASIEWSLNDIWAGVTDLTGMRALSSTTAETLHSYHDWLVGVLEGLYEGLHIARGMLGHGAQPKAKANASAKSKAKAGGKAGAKGKAKGKSKAKAVAAPEPSTAAV